MKSITVSTKFIICRLLLLGLQSIVSLTQNVEGDCADLDIAVALHLGATLVRSAVAKVDLVDAKSSLLSQKLSAVCATTDEKK